jgi:glycosyltransferase involved in cell wall biosynthesis/SAM-dependent methyltransferase
VAVSVAVEIVEVERAPRDERLWGGYIDTPRPGDGSGDGVIELVGWALGRSAPVQRIEFLSGGALVGATRANVRRPDLEGAFPEASANAGGGFRARLNLLGDAERELELVAVLRDDARVALGRILARPRWRESTEPGEMALVSVVIPCFDQSAFLEEAIESVLAQTYPHFELIVVDDGSTDTSAEVARRHPGVRLLQQENRGLPAARNAGLREAAGEFVTFLDADDRLKPRALEIGLRTLRERPDCAFVAGQVELTGHDGSLLRAAHHRIVDRDHYRMLLQGNDVLSHATVMYRRAVFDVVGAFDPALAACEDYDLYLRIAQRFPIHMHDHCVAEYRRHGGNMHRDPARMLTAALAALRKQRKAARRTVADRRAYALGVEHWRREFGGQLVDDLRDRVAVRDFGRETRRRLLVLARHHRAGLREVRRGRPTPHAPLDGRVRRETPRLGRVRWGDLRRLEPIGEDFGFERGTPVDRRYIEDFLARHAEDVRGRVLEVADPAYTRRFGGAAVTASEVIHLSRDNPAATIVGDLTDATHIPDASFDCAIVTETLHLVYDVTAALRTLHRILRPGGVLLATFPGMSQIDDSDTWCWSFTTLSARRMVGEIFGEGNVELESRGNVLAATAFLHGIAAEELAPEEIDHPDPRYPMSIHVRAVRSGRPDGWWQADRKRT